MKTNMTALNKNTNSYHLMPQFFSIYNIKPSRS